MVKLNIPECFLTLVAISSVPFSATANSYPQEHSYVLTTPQPALQNEGDMAFRKPLSPEIYSFRVQSDITHRYSRTYVTSKVANRNGKAQEITFSVVLPETAFISRFVMEIDGKSYEAYVKEKEEAKKDYSYAQSQGHSAGLVEKSTRNSNMFNVNVNVKAEAKVTFNLTYEELLTRRLGSYEQAINVNPDQISSIEDYQIVVNIEDARNLSFVRVANSSNEIDKPEAATEVSRNVVIERPAPNKAKISWSPTTKEQKSLGNSGKFIVQYDIDRATDGGQVLVMEGYFVHFFSPENLPPMKKHVVFILDISGSMYGRKIEQLKESQKKILSDLTPDDYFNIITFSSEVHLWSVNDPIVKEHRHTGIFGRSHNSEDMELTPPQWYAKREPLPANPENIKKAKEFIDSLEANGGTDIHGAISEGLNLTAVNRQARQNKQEEKPNPYEFKVILPPTVQSLILFLTDGEPTSGITGLSDIQKGIQSKNRDMSIPIFSLAFGQGADFQFLKQLSLQNHGFARKIYEAADAALQLRGFYNEIASPLLANVTFNYTSNDYQVKSLTVTRFPTVFGGTEIAVAGQLERTNATQNVSDSQMDEQDKSDGGAARNKEGAAVDDIHAKHYPYPPCFFRPAHRHYFDISVDGNGRDGGVMLRKVLIYDRPWRCGPWPRPLPPPPPHEPKPPRSPEDQFLERLWAYLTIHQLIEQDLASGDTASGKESKARALQLALRYGFVTSLTSLVVVKPNSSDVTNAEAADGSRPEHGGYGGGAVGGMFMGANGGGGMMPMMMASYAAPMHFAKKGVMFKPSMTSQDRIVGGEDNAGAPRGRPPPGNLADKQSDSDSADDEMDGSSTGKSHRKSQQHASNKTLSLNDITWLKVDQQMIRINETDYKIARNKTGDDDSGHACTISKPQGGVGQCQHLQKCVLQAFIGNEKTFKKNYFCPIKSKSSNEAFAGVCCPSKTP